jgi:hypothetical protein
MVSRPMSRRWVATSPKHDTGELIEEPGWSGELVEEGELHAWSAWRMVDACSIRSTLVPVG